MGCSKPSARRIIGKGLAAGTIFTAWWVLYFQCHHVDFFTYEAGSYTFVYQIFWLAAIVFATGILCLGGTKKWGWSLFAAFLTFFLVRFAVIPRLPNGHAFLYGDFLFISELPDVRRQSYKILWKGFAYAAAGVVLIRFLRRDRIFDAAAQKECRSSPNSPALQGVLLSLVFLTEFVLSSRYASAVFNERRFSYSFWIDNAFRAWAVILGSAILWWGSSCGWRRSLAVGMLVSLATLIPVTLWPAARKLLLRPSYMYEDWSTLLYSGVWELFIGSFFMAICMIVIRIIVYRNEIREDILDWWDHV